MPESVNVGRGAVGAGTGADVVGNGVGAIGLETGVEPPQPMKAMGIRQIERYFNNGSLTGLVRAAPA